MKRSDNFSSRKLMLARRENGLTQNELASKIGRSRNTVVLWESGRFTPEEASVNKLSEVLKKPVSYFFEAEKNELGESSAEYGTETSVRSLKTSASDNTLMLPLLAGIPENLPLYAEKDIESFVQIPRYLFPGADFMIRYTGESHEAGIGRDDLCVLRKTSEAIPGKLLLTRTEKGVSFTRVSGKSGKAVIRPGTATIIGEVIGIWKRISG